MKQKTALIVLGLTLFAAMISMGVISKGGIAGSSTFGIRPECPRMYNDVQSRIDPVPTHCFAAINPDGTENKHYMCCNEYLR